jgi:hypothetical protein
MNVLEIDESVNDIKKALGFTVQSVSFYDKTLVLKLWQNHMSYLLLMSVRWGQQGVFLLNDHGKSKLKIDKKPIHLFATTHLKNCTLTDVSRDEDVGRQVHFLFSDHESDEIKVTVGLIPSSLNISIYKGVKSIHLQKPKESPEMKSMDLSQMKVRTLEDLKKPWLEELWPQLISKQKSKILLNLQETPHLNSSLNRFQLEKEPFDLVNKIEKKLESLLQKEIEKKKKVLIKVMGDKAEKMKDHFFDFANLLSVDPEQAKQKYPEFYDDKKNIHKLKNEYFEKHKQVTGKRKRVEERVSILKDEIKTLESMTEEEWLKKRLSKNKSKPDFKSPVKTRKLELAPDLVAYLGKSAADNLKLLRSAKSWHMWFHIKDLPSAHMIVFKDKSRALSEDEIKKASIWLLSEVSSNTNDLKGQLFEVLMTECRHVKPIKGDKVGRVNYTHEQIYRLRL